MKFDRFSIKPNFFDANAVYILTLFLYLDVWLVGMSAVEYPSASSVLTLTVGKSNQTNV